MPLLHIEETGQGPVIVLLHGFLASGQYWQGCTELLKRHHRVVTVDLLGFGASPKPRRSRYDYAHHIKAIHQTLLARGYDGPVVLVGHSMGSLLAMRYARQFPALVRGLVLLNPPLLKSRREARRTYLGNSLLYRLGLTLGIHRLVWPLYRLATYTRLLGTSLAQETEPFTNYLFQHTAASRYRSFKRIIVQSHGLEDLAAQTVPTLVMNSTSDRMVYRRNAENLPKTPTMKMITVPGDHHVPLKQPALTSDQIERFVAGLPAI